MISALRFKISAYVLALLLFWSVAGAAQLPDLIGSLLEKLPLPRHSRMLQTIDDSGSKYGLALIDVSNGKSLRIDKPLFWADRRRSFVILNVDDAKNTFTLADGLPDGLEVKAFTMEGQEVSNRLVALPRTNVSGSLKEPLSSFSPRGDAVAYLFRDGWKLLVKSLADDTEKELAADLQCQPRSSLVSRKREVILHRICWVAPDVVVLDTREGGNEDALYAVSVSSGKRVEIDRHPARERSKGYAMLRAFSDNDDAPLESEVMSRDGRFLAQSIPELFAAAGQPCFVVYDTVTGAKIYKSPAPGILPRWSPSGNVLAAWRFLMDTNSPRFEICILKIPEGKEERTGVALRLGSSMPGSNHGMPVDMAFLDNDRIMYSIEGLHGQKLYIHSLATKKTTEIDSGVRFDCFVPFANGTKVLCRTTERRTE